MTDAGPPSLTHAKPTLLFDGDCGFCRRWIARWQVWTGVSVTYLPYQEAGQRFSALSQERLEEAVHLVNSNGQVSRGAQAVFKVLSLAPGKRWLQWAYNNVPGFARASELAYRFVAKHRVAFSKLSFWLWGDRIEPPRHFLIRRVFLKAMGVVYFTAFASLWWQLGGLIGSKGILPAADYLNAVSSRLGAERFHLLPTLAWINSSDTFLHFMCGGGIALSIALIFNLAPALCLTVLWALYLSFCTIAQDFLSFQWDILLLEAGFLAIFLAPWKIRPRLDRESAPSSVALLLCSWLLFKLMFSSGAVKLASGDETWRNLTALQHHYETQPLPTPLAWYLHQLPAWFHKIETVMMFAVELVLPFLIFLPRRPRLVAFAGIVSLQLFIAATGNYTFFNLLTVALALLLLDDNLVEQFLPKNWVSLSSSASLTTLEPAGKRALTAVFACISIGVGLMHVSSSIYNRADFPRAVTKVYEWIAPLRLVNSYGLFAVMTKPRREITIEGSTDGNIWRPYEFKWKPGDLNRAPPIVAPHQPRLDWQMWFAALGSFNRNYWLQNFMGHLLAGTPEVLRLIADNPFAGAAPKYVRARIARYQFTTAGEKSQTGAWWKRDKEELYSPTLMRTAAP